MFFCIIRPMRFSIPLPAAATSFASALALSVAVAVAVAIPAVVRGEQFVVATYNIENFRENFQAQTLKPVAATQPAMDAEFMRRLQKEDDEDNWEVAATIADPRFDPDILVIQEGCTQEQLNAFNNRWLHDAYATALVFPSNTERDQHVGLLMKPGFKVLEKRDQYYLEPDTVPNPRGDRLFARGPAFVLVESPGGYRFWVGTNHQKSKSGNDVDVTKWRTREAARTNQIVNEVARASGTADVIFLGDMNDEVGYQEFELAAGGDTIGTLVGSGPDELFLATRKLSDAGGVSFGGYWDARRRTFIDHIVTTPSMRPKLDEPVVVNWGVARVASDHYPVMVRVRVDR